jgi:two-component system, OmpR family, sensor kinase
LSLRTRLTVAVGYLLLLSLIAFGLPLGVSLSDRVDTEVRAQASNQADVVAATAHGLLVPAERDTLRRLVDSSARTLRGRVIVVDGSGRLIADSVGDAELGADYSSRPEIATALQGRSTQETRNSNTLGIDLLATAVPVLDRGAPEGAVRVTQSVEAVSHATREAIVHLALLGGVVLALGVIAAALIARDTSRPIGRLEQAARRVEEGDLDATSPVEGSSEQRSLARSFNRMTARISRLLRGQQDFVADASHQLRTPLTGIRLHLEELREEAGDGGRGASELDAGLEEVDRLSRIVDELLLLSRAGEHELPAERIELGEAGRRACERWRKAAADRGVELACRAAAGTGSVSAAPADFDRALDSLIENAIRYSPRGGEVSVAAAPGRIEVLDRGPGLAPGEEDAVFERFHRGSAGRAGVKGTGLGLPIARELAGQWGGTVSLRNRDDGGACAALEFPRSPARAAEASGAAR